MKIIKSEGKTEIRVSPNKNWKSVIVFIPVGIVMVLFFSSVLFDLTVSLARWDFKNNTFEVLGMLLLTFIIINYSLWLLIGKEKVIFHENIMIYTITNGLFGRTKQVEIGTIKNLKAVDKVFNSELPFFPDAGRIKFECKGDYFSILRGLKDADMQEVTEIFKEHINKNIL